MRALDLTAEETVALGHGRRIASAGFAAGEPVAGFAPDGRLVAVLKERGDGAAPALVLAPIT
jgi:tRNA pseudouridine55 synthase